MSIIAIDTKVSEVTLTTGSDTYILDLDLSQINGFVVSNRVATDRLALVINFKITTHEVNADASNAGYLEADMVSALNVVVSPTTSNFKVVYPIDSPTGTFQLIANNHKSLGTLGVSKFNVLNTNRDNSIGKFAFKLQTQKTTIANLCVLTRALITLYDGN